MYCLQLSNLFYLEFKLPGNIYLVQSVYQHCTPELKIVSGTKEAIRWLTEWRRKGMDFEVSAEYQGLFYCSDCCDYPLRNTLRWLIIVPSLHEKFGLWLELVSFPSFQSMVFGSFRWKTFFFPSNRFIHRHTGTWDKRLNVEIHHYQEESIRRTRHAVWGTLVILEILRQKNVAKFGWILLLSLFLEIDYFSSLDGSVISWRHLSLQAAYGQRAWERKSCFSLWWLICFHCLPKLC